MALLGKALFTWFLVLLFMILVAYRYERVSIIIQETLTF